jgi:Cd2+/Zn2+-exporting ATPase
VLSGEVNTHVLMAAAVVGTLVLGFPAEGAALLLLFQVSHSLEHRFTATARVSLSRLLDNAPTSARVVGTLESGDVDWQSQADVEAASVAIGSLVAVKAGEMVPLDGVIVSGRALVGTLLHLVVCSVGACHWLHVLVVGSWCRLTGWARVSEHF